MLKTRAGLFSRPAHGLARFNFWDYKAFRWLLQGLSCRLENGSQECEKSEPSDMDCLINFRGVDG